MSSWPKTQVSWGALTPQLRAGDLVCVVHGLVDERRMPIGIPACPVCGQATMRARFTDERLSGFVMENLPHCLAAERHPFTGGEVSLGWTSCTCANAVPGPGGHQSWRCRRCMRAGRDETDSTLMWPPHRP